MAELMEVHSVMAVEDGLSFGFIEVTNAKFS